MELIETIATILMVTCQLCHVTVIKAGPACQGFIVGLSTLRQLFGYEGHASFIFPLPPPLPGIEHIDSAY